MLFSAVCFCLLQLSRSKPLERRWNDVAEKHSWADLPKGWEYHAPAPPDHIFELRIGLKQDGIDSLIKSLMEISNPSHARYGQHLTKEESDSLAAPHPGSTDAVTEWLQFHGLGNSVNHLTAGGDWLAVQVSVEQAERMLDTKYNIYHHPATGQNVIRTLAYSLPRELHPHVDVVTPTTYFTTIRSMQLKRMGIPRRSPVRRSVSSSQTLVMNGVVPASCNSSVTPACMRALYNTAAYVPRATNVNKIGITGYLDQFASFSDLQDKAFFRLFRPEAVGFNFTVVQVNGGGNDQTNPGSEADLDVQCALSMAFPTPATFWSTAGVPPFIPDDNTPENDNEPYLDWLNFILKQTTIPQVITTSYDDDEQTVPLDFATKVCNMLAQLTSRGTTIFFCTGDFGVGGSDCKTNDGTNRTLFQPQFPATCPFVTAVGGTQQIKPEVAADFSGGGFSRHFNQPSYQHRAVSTFLSGLGNKYAGLFNPAGRAIPDVSAQSNFIEEFFDGDLIQNGGTSASTPVVAGIFALLNDFRLSKNMTTLGFINPLIYSNAIAGFNDVVSGDNPGCGTNGFTAVKGWDPVTGLGTPDFLKLQKLLG